MQKLLFWFWVSGERYMMPCMNKKLFGVECPGCGLQRSVLLLFNGDFVAAFKMYPAIYTLIPLLLLVVINRFYKTKSISFLIITFSISSVALILINYIIKLIH